MTTPSNRTLVFGDDNSPGADIAWLWVNNHRWPDWRIDVVTATPPPMPPLAEGDKGGPLHEWQPPMPRTLFAEAGAAGIRHLARATDPRLLLDQQHDAGLLVVAPRGMTHLQAHLLGSTTEFLLHRPPAPLAVIRSATATRRVVACVDGSAAAATAVAAFLRLPWAASCHVVLLAVDDGRADVAGALSATEQHTAAAGVETSRHEVRGRPRDVIPAAVGELDAQLVVMGTRGLTGWQRLHVGSTANRIVRRAQHNILVAADSTTEDA